MAIRSLLSVGAVVGVIALLFVGAGGVDVAADKPHSWLTYRVLHFAFGQSVGVRASSIVPPDDLDSAARIRLGAQQFHLVCSNCHGGPGIGQSPLALSMEPRPQSLPSVVGQFSDAELFWILQHGVKFSAMPAWSTKTRDDEVWSTVAFVRKLPTMTAAEYLALTAPPEADPGIPSAVPPFSAPDALRPADTARNVPYQAPNEYLYAVPALGFGDRTAMANPLALCGRCHGADGTGMIAGGEAPNLVIQDPEYIRASLEAYATGGRRSGYMQPIAAQLSDHQIAALADWYAALPDKSSGTVPANPEVEARGRKIATEGLSTVALPACATCHEGEVRARIGAPRLEGQSAVFLRRQLTAMRDRNRGSTRFWNPMPAVAGHLTDADIEALAVHYASQPPAGAATSPSLAARSAIGGDPAKGEQMFGAICARCHTPAALGDEAGDIPNLTLQLPRYVASALRAYRSNERQNTRMHLVAQDLDDDEIEALAAYVGGLPPRPARLSPVVGTPERGEAIAHDGIPDRKLPGCLTCHEAGMTAALPLIPRLDGQNAEYLRKKLDYFAGPQASQLSLLNPMPAIARNLTETERADLAAYFAAGRPFSKQTEAN
ncbi:c-type cytochrome [Aureimonas leprariae]|uniref:c-type cytochrome n=1 Tax=Plantimonas leprariae TaxID=2615207 RepID=UPI001386DE3B|nr:c-type cytochrome [Aureimonas leprariae]